MVRHLIAIPCLLAGLLLLAGCNQLDPYHRQGMWEPSGANAANLAAMVADPRDLIRGRESRTLPSSKDQVVAVGRVWSGTVAKSSSGSASGGATAAMPGG